MTSNVKVTPPKGKTLEMEGTELPLLDLSEAPVKELIRSAKRLGYVTHDQINALLSSEGAKSEQIEDILEIFALGRGAAIRSDHNVPFRCGPHGRHCKLRLATLRTARDPPFPAALVS